MNSKRWVVYITTLFTVISGSVFLVLNLLDNSFIETEPFSFLNEIMCGFFTGAIVSLFLGLSDYFTTRNEILFNDLSDELFKLYRAYQKIDYLWFPAPKKMFLNFLNEHENNLTYKDNFPELVSCAATDALKNWIWEQLPDKQKSSYFAYKDDFLNTEINNIYNEFCSNCKKISEQLIDLKNINFTSFKLVCSKIYFLKFWNNTSEAIINEIYEYQKETYNSVCETAFHARIYLEKNSKTAIIAELLSNFQDKIFESAIAMPYLNIYNLHSFTTEFLKSKLYKHLAPKKYKKVQIEKNNYYKCGRVHFVNKNNCVDQFTSTKNEVTPSLDAVMKVIDSKDFKYSQIRKFCRRLDKKLAKCKSLDEQKNILVDTYQGASYERDFLIGRQLQIKRNLKYNTEWFLNKYLDVFVSYVCGIFSLPLYQANPLAFIGVVLGLFFYFCFDVKKICMSLRKREQKTFEIKQLELSFIQDVLSSNNDEFNILNSCLFKKSI